MPRTIRPNGPTWTRRRSARRKVCNLLFSVDGWPWTGIVHFRKRKDLMPAIVPEAVVACVREWTGTRVSYDGTVSGVLADLMEESRSDIAAMNGDDPELMPLVDKCIRFMRERTTARRNNENALCGE